MKALKFTLLSLCLLGILSSCKTKEEPVPQTDFAFDLGKAVFYGDIYNNGSNIFDVYLMDPGLSIDQNGWIVGTGYYLYLDLNTSTNTINIPTGTYTAGTDGSNFTFQQGDYYTYTGTLNRPNDFNHPEGSYIAKVIDDQAIEFYLLNSGSIKIYDNSITGNFTSTDGVNLTFTYSGNINDEIVDDITPFPSNLTQGQLWFWGDADGVGLNVFTIRLGDSNTDMTNLTGGGDMMMIEVYTPLSVTTQLPNGTYPVKVNSPEVHTAIDGYLNNGDYYGSWYFTPARDYAITQGSVTVTYKTGNTYTLAFDLQDDYNTSIVRSAFDVSLGYYDKTLSGVKQMMRVPKGKVSAQKKTINTKFRTGRSK